MSRLVIRLCHLLAALSLATLVMLPAGKAVVCGANVVQTSQRETSARPRYSLSLPNPIDGAFAEVVAFKLSLSSAQNEYFKVFLRGYREKWDACINETEAMLRMLAETAAAALSNVDPGVHAEAYRQFVEFEEQVRSRLEESDRSLFSALETVLAEVQLPSLESVREMRRRECCWVVPRKVLASQIDLAKAARGLFWSNKDVIAAIEPALLNYESEVTRPFVAVHVRYLRDRVAREQIVAAIRIRGPDFDLRNSERIRMMREQADSQDEVRRINERFVREFKESFPEDAYKQLRNHYRLRAYPEVYPEPVDVESVLAIIATADAAEAQSEVIASLVKTFQERLESVRSNLEKTAAAIQFARASENEHLVPALNQDFDRQRLQRSGMMRDWLQQIESLLPPEQAARVSEIRRTLPVEENSSDSTSEPS